MEGALFECLPKSERCGQHGRYSAAPASGIAGHYPAGVIHCADDLLPRLPWGRLCGLFCAPAFVSQYWGGYARDQCLVGCSNQRGGIVVPVLASLLAFILIALSILLWAGEYFHLKSKQRDAREVEEAQACSTKYSRLSMEELLPEQERALREVEEVRKQMPR